jgi:opine dehydrogenase
MILNTNESLISFMNISIIGAGNGGQAMAAHFTILGHKVTLYNRTIEKISNLLENPEIELTETINGKVKIAKVTTKISEAIIGAELIMVTTTADAHKYIAKQIAPYVEDNQIIVLNPGRTLGAIEFAGIIKETTKKRIYIAESQSLIYACRIDKPGLVRIIGIKNKVLLSAYPSVDTDYVINILNSIYNCFVKTENALVTSLENIGAIFHPPVVLLNSASIERGNMFYFYNDMTPKIADFIEQMDYERLEIGKSFGIRLLTVSEWVSFAYENIKGETLCEKMKNNPAYDKILAPKLIESRLIMEDVPTGLIPFVELAKLGNVKTPIMNSVISILQVLTKTDFYKNGRTLKNLNLDNITIKQFLNNL